MYQKPTVPRSIGGVLDDSIRLFKASFSKAVVPSLLMSAVVVVQLLVQMRSGLLTAGSSGIQGLMGASAAAASAGSALASFLGSLVDVVLYGAVVVIVIGVSRGDAPTFGAAFGAAWRRFGAMLGASILVGFIAGFGLILAFIPVFLNLSGVPTG